MALKGCKCGLAWAWMFLAAGGWAGGCAPPPGGVILDTSSVKPAADYTDLAIVLKRAVGRKGMLIPKAARECASHLDAQLKLLAVSGPTVTPALFPSQEDTLAYWYNARAAWAIKLSLMQDCPDELSRACLEERSFPLDGRRMTLDEIDAILGRQEDWRVLVAAPDVRQQRSALPDQPFTSADIHKTIAERFNQFVADDRRFVIDVEQRKLLVPPVLWPLRHRLTDEHNRTYRTQGATLVTALLPYVSGAGRRRLQDAIGYRTVSARPAGMLAFIQE